MSRIGKMPVRLPKGVSATLSDGNTVTVEVFIKNEAGNVIAPGVATAEIIA